MVDNVERFRPELQSETVSECETTGDCEIQVHQSRADEHISPEVPKGLDRRGKTRRCHPMQYSLGPCERIASRNIVGTVRQFACVADVAGIIRCEWTPGLNGEYTGKLPASRKLAREALCQIAFAFAKGKLADDREHHAA